MTQHFPQPRHAEEDLFVIGRGIGPVGRWSRLFLGLYFLAFLVLNPLYLHPVPRDEIGTLALTVAGFFLLIAAFYFAAFYLVSDAILSRMSPWVGTIIFVGLPTTLGLLGLFPRPVQMAFGLYVGCSLIVIFFMRYGGCEVVGLPSLLLKRRFTLYCPFNAMPLVQLTMSTIAHYRQEQDLLAPRVRKFGLGAVVLALAIVVFLLEGVSSQQVFAGAMVLAGLSLLFRGGALVIRRRRLRLSTTNHVR
jgi:hypothetical protein